MECHAGLKLAAGYIHPYVPEMFCIIYMSTSCLVCLTSRKIKIDDKITKMENK